MCGRTSDKFLFLATHRIASYFHFFLLQCHGITLSPVQAERAQALAADQILSHKVSFQVVDALNQPFQM
ncbi:hypothetical protein L2E82_16863 [Cichorium intybus]|uniref:Uncharacterized protein n=1 Tax=Cichorium intybus TaxID=13427 RepID=A0ACB9F758_CICIN|nr:hypothetical protein L2E82_16863 [Cichorium intybus]